MPDEDDRPITEEEQALAREGQSLIAAAMADVRAPQSLREAIERERQRAASRDRPRFWRRCRWGLAAAGTAAAVLAVVAIALETGGSDTTDRRSTGSTRLRVWIQRRQRRARSVAPHPCWRPRSAISRSRTGESHSAGRRSAAAWTSPQGATSTVFYRNPEGIRLGYAVVAGTALGDDPPGREITETARPTTSRATAIAPSSPGPSRVTPA